MMIFKNIFALGNEKTKEALVSNIVHGVVRFLFEFFYYYRTEEMINENPCSKVVLPKRKKCRVKTLTKQERVEIYNRLRRNLNQKTRLVLVALLSKRGANE